MMHYCFYMILYKVIKMIRAPEILTPILIAKYLITYGSNVLLIYLYYLILFIYIVSQKWK